MRLPSPSELFRAQLCPASAVLPRSGSTSPAATRGTLVHEIVLREPRVFDPESVPAEFRDFLLSIDFERIPIAEHYEKMYAYNVKTGEARAYDQQEARKENEMVGRIDLCDVRQHDGRQVAYAGDLKTGQGLQVATAAENLQLGWGALVVAREAGLSEAIVDIIHIADNGYVKTDPVFLDAAHLEAVEIEIQDIVGKVKEAATVIGAGGVPRVVTGPHCNYCPAFTACPEQRALASLLGENPEKALPCAELTHDNIVQVYWRAKAAREVLRRVDSAIYGFVRASGRPLQVGEGLRFGPVTKTRKKIDPQIARTVLREAFGEEVANALSPPTASQTGLRRALKLLKGPVAPLFRKVLAVIEEEGGVERSSRESIELYKMSDEGKELEEGDDE